MTRITRRQTFIIDGIGALVSVLLLGVILPMFADRLGLPPHIFRSLALWALGCLVFDTLVLASFPEPPRKWLARVMSLNATYCVITACLMWQHQDVITVLGWSYFALEMLVLMCLVYWESLIYRHAS